MATNNEFGNGCDEIGIGHNNLITNKANEIDMARASVNILIKKIPTNHDS